jgi:hypothetical protein
MPQSDDLQGDDAIETLLTGSKDYALSAAPNFLEQFVIAQFSQHLGQARRFCAMVSSSAVICVRPGYGGGARVAHGYGLVSM